MPTARGGSLVLERLHRAVPRYIGRALVTKLTTDQQRCTVDDGSKPSVEVIWSLTRCSSGPGVARLSTASSVEWRPAPGGDSSHMSIVLPAALVATVFLLSSFSKIRGLVHFRAALDEYTLLSWLRPQLKTALAGFVPLAEAAVGVGLLVPGVARVAAPAAVLFAGAFTVVIGFDSRESIAHCGCWGVLPSDAPTPFYLSRALLLLLAAGGAAALSYFTVLPGLRSEFVAIALCAPFALLLLELPAIGQIAILNRVSEGET